jgi:trehalose-phosphatase
VKSSAPKHLFDCLPYVRKQWLYSKRIVLFLDFDGTLAPIAPAPSLARLVPEMPNLLKHLSEDRQVAMVFISGRSVEDLKRILQLENAIYAGNHGLEISGPTLNFVHSGATEAGPIVAQVCESLEKRFLPLCGVHIENKQLTASIHFRLASEGDFPRMRSLVEEAVGQLRGRLCITEGKCVFEIRPDVDWNKGKAARFILKQLREVSASAIYLGDDRTDEDAFRLLRHSLTVHVGLHLDGTAARYFVRSPEGVYGFLEYLRFLRQCGSTLATLP